MSRIGSRVLAGIAFGSSLDFPTLFDQFGRPLHTGEAGLDGKFAIEAPANYYPKAGDDLERAPHAGRGTSPRTDPTPVDWNVPVFGHELPTDVIERVQDQIGALDRRRADQNGEIVKIKVEMSFRDTVQRASAPTAALGAIPGGSPKVSWKLGNSDPLHDAAQIVHSRRRATGLMFDTMFVSDADMVDLQANASLRGYLDRIGGTIAGDGDPFLTPEDVKKAFKVRAKIDVAVGSALTGANGYAGTFALEDVWPSGTVVFARMKGRRPPTMVGNKIYTDPVACLPLSAAPKGEGFNGDGWRSGVETIDANRQKVYVDAMYGWVPVYDQALYRVTDVFA